MSKTAKITLENQTYEFPVVTGSEGEKAISLGGLRDKTGYVTLDPGYVNTGATTSEVTFLDGERGVLRYRGIPIEDIVENATFVETSYLLIYGRLPTRTELKKFSEDLTYHSMLHESMRHFYDGFPSNAHPMSVLSSMVCSLSAYYSDADQADPESDVHITRLLSKVRTIAAFSYKKNIGQPFVYPKNSLGYCENFLHMMYAVPAEPYEVDPMSAKALNTLLILHADHEQNCSTSTVRLVGSSGATLYAAISAGICALWGPLHGGANQAVMGMLADIRDSGGDYKGFMETIKDKSSGKRLMGFGHRVYKNYDPRAKILKKMADGLLEHLGVNDPLLDIARNLEEIALTDDYFVERKLYPNVDFYSGILYKALGIPEEMFTVMFALGRMPGWIAQWREMMLDPKKRIGRPRQIYTGECKRAFTPMDQRKGA